MSIIAPFYNEGEGVDYFYDPKRLILENSGHLLIKFSFKKPISPAELGLSVDGRRLGLGLVSLELKPVD